MGFSNFEKTDLIGDALKNLLTELQTAVNNKNYGGLIKFAQDFATAIKTETFYVDENGQRMVKVATTEKDPTTGNIEPKEMQVDINDVTKQMMSILEQIQMQGPKDATEAKEQIKTIQEINKQIGAIFQEDKIMEELKERGVQPQDFIDKAKEANEESDKRIGTLKNKKNGIDKAYGKVFGNDLQDGKGGYITKSLLTEIVHSKYAEAKLDDILKLVTDINDAKDAIDVIEADPSLSDEQKNQMKANIQANIDQMKADIEGMLQDIIKLEIPGVDSRRLAKAIKKEPIDKTEIEDIKASVVNGLTNLYNDLKEAIKTNRADLKAALNSTGITIPDDAAIDGMMPEDLDKLVQKLQEVQNRVNEAIKREETIKKLREDGVVQYERDVADAKDISKNFDSVTGEPTEAFLEEIESKFNKDAERAQIEREKTAERDAGITKFESLSKKEKKAELKKMGVKWFIFRNLDKTYKKITAKALPGEIDASYEARRRTFIEEKVASAKDQYRSLGDKLAGMMNNFTQYRRGAEVQEQVQAGVHQGMQKNGYGHIKEEDKDQIGDAMQGASLDHAMLQYGLGIATDLEKKRAEAALRGYSSAKREGKKQGIRKDANTQIHKDEGEER